MLSKIFDDISFNAIEDSLFRQLVLSRLIYPVSKLKTSDFLDRYHEMEYPVHQIYRYMDKFHSQRKELSLDREISDHYERYYLQTLLDNIVNYGLSGKSTSKRI